MVETAGTKLRRARQLRQLSIEDASRATKIRVRQLADLEADEYSNFANLAYARSFLVAYGKYLHVDTRPYMEAFADASTFGLDDYQYLSEEPLGMYRSTRRTVRRKPKRQQIVAACAVAGLMAVLLFGRVVYNTYERLGDVEKIAARREARAHWHERQGGCGHDGSGTRADNAPAQHAARRACGRAGFGHAGAGWIAGRRWCAAGRRAGRCRRTCVRGIARAHGPPGPGAEPGDGRRGAVARRWDGGARHDVGPAGAQTRVRPDASATHRAPVFRVDEPQPQKVVNNDPGRPVN